jgi:hypothetical protein
VLCIENFEPRHSKPQPKNSELSTLPVLAGLSLSPGPELGADFATVLFRDLVPSTERPHSRGLQSWPASRALPADWYSYDSGNSNIVWPA